MPSQITDRTDSVLNPPHDTFMQCLEHTNRDPFWGKIRGTYAKQIRLDLLDTIELTPSELVALLSLPPTQNPPETPALPEFRLIVHCDSCDLSLSFKQSIVRGLHFRRRTRNMGGTDDRRNYEALFDLHYSDEPDGATQAVFCVYGSDQDYATEADEIIFPTSLCWSRGEAYPTRLTAAQLDDLLGALADIFLSVQKLFYERPELLLEAATKRITVESREHQHKRKKSAKPKPNKVKIVRQIYLQPTDIPSVAGGSGRVYTCPHWGVSGHYRTYKSGKRVWIAPYHKGKERNNPAAYVAKQYLPIEEDGKEEMPAGTNEA